MKGTLGPHLSVVIPAYNEERRLPRTLDEVVRYLARQPYEAEILVVDDGCRDRTAQLVRDRATSTPIPIRLIEHADRCNHGKGAAVRSGMSAACGRFRLFMDADHAIAIDHLDQFWPFFDAGYDVVIGTRQAWQSDGGSRRPWHREFAGRVGSCIIRTLVIPDITNTQTGFKMFTAECAERVFSQLTIAGWGFDVEVLAICRQLGCSIKEVSVKALSRPDSKVTLRAYLQVLADVWRVRSNARSGRYK